MLTVWFSLSWSRHCLGVCNPWVSAIPWLQSRLGCLQSPAINAHGGVAFVRNTCWRIGRMKSSSINGTIPSELFVTLQSLRVVKKPVARLSNLPLIS